MLHQRFGYAVALLTLSWLQLSSGGPIEGVEDQREDKSEDLSIDDEYDFIICGGGTAGLVLGNRLSESGNNRVLVLEAGPNPEVVAAYEAPGGNQMLGGTAIDWAFFTAPQEHLDGRILQYHRGRALGGSSVTNGFYYGRGSSTIYDKWEKLGNPGWGWNETYPLFKKSTHFNPPNIEQGFDLTYKTWDEDAYDDGPLQLGFQGYVPQSSVAFIQACEAANIPIVNDLNSGDGVGVKQGPGTLDSKFRRSSSYDAFYKPIADRPNLDVIHSASVQNLVTDTDGSTPRVTGVEFIYQPSGLVYELKAKKEVIVSMGAFQSPQLLMVSGIGPSNQLEEFGIEPVLIREDVGQHLNDHSVFSIMANAVPESVTSDMYATFSNLRAAQDEFYANSSGPYTAPSGITNGFQMLSNKELEEIGAGDLVNEGLVNQAHIEYLYESIWYPGGPTTPGGQSSPGEPTSYYTPLLNESYISLTASSMVALSRGNVTLRGAGMSAAPIINPNYYSHPTDRAIAIQSFKYLRKILAHPALSNFTTGLDHGEVSPGSAVSDDDDDAIFEYIKANTIPNWHAAGTNRMLPLEDGGVVDPRLRVYGVDNLRVVDCSVIPFLPDVNILGSVYMIAEKGAQMISEDWGDG